MILCKHWAYRLGGQPSMCVIIDHQAWSQAARTITGHCFKRELKVRLSPDYL